MTDIDILEKILNQVATYYKQDIEEVKGKSRIAAIVKSRCMVSALACLNFNFSYTEVGKFLNKDRVSIIHLVKKAHVGHWLSDKKYQFDFTLNYSTLLGEIKDINLDVSLDIIDKYLLEIKASCSLISREMEKIDKILIKIEGEKYQNKIIEQIQN